MQRVCRGPALCTPHRRRRGERLTQTQDQRVPGEHTIIPVPTQPVESRPTGRPEHPPAYLPARLQWAGGDTHSFPANAQLGPETENKHVTSPLDLRSADLQRRREKTGKCRQRTLKQAPGHWRQAVMQEGPRPSATFHSSPPSYKNSFSQSLSFQG